MLLFEIWIKINLNLKLLWIFLTKETLSYTEELYLFTVYIILFIIMYYKSLNNLKKNVTQQAFELIVLYEKLIYVKSLLLKKIKKNYTLLKKCEYIKKIVKMLYSRLYLEKKKIKKKIVNNKLYLIILNFKNSLTKANKIKNYSN